MKQGQQSKTDDRKGPKSVGPDPRLVALVHLLARQAARATLKSNHSEETDVGPHDD